MTGWIRWLGGVTAGALLWSAPALAQGYNTYPSAPPPGQETFAPPPAQPEHDELGFRGALAPYGEWLFVPGLGQVWRPYERVVGPGFQPYVTAGHWVYTEYGWFWESDYPWGWAPFHYGRWTYRPRWGWVWRPGQVWAPAWVEWRYGAGYVGWSALSSEELAAMEGALRLVWCFVETMNFLSSRLNAVALPPERARSVITVTHPVTARRSFGERSFVIGPPPAHVAQAVGRPVRPVSAPPRAPGGWHARAPVPAPMPVPAPPPGEPASVPPPGLGRGASPPPGSGPVFIPPPPPARREDREDREERRERIQQRLERIQEERERRDEWREERRERRQEERVEREEREERRAPPPPPPRRDEPREERDDDKGGSRGHGGGRGKHER